MKFLSSHKYNQTDSPFKNICRKLNTKENGNMADLIGTSICLLAIMMVVITSVHFYKILEVKRQVATYARDYLLELETQGELTTENETNLVNSLKGMGFNNVTVVWNGGEGKKNHGEEVGIQIIINATRQELGLSKVYDFILDNYTISTVLYSTSKY